jgi:hypothetical protein
MVGVITSLDILAHPIVTIECFGWQVFFQAIMPWHNTPFLSLVRDAGFAKPTGANVSKILERCITLELRAMRIYRILAKALDDQGLVGTFFAGLVEQEQYHADLLEIARAAAIRKGWKANMFNPWQDYLPRLERQMDVAEAAVCSIDSIDAALQMVIDLESSEVNLVFHSAIAATDAAFVQKLKPFQKAMEAHMRYIIERLPQLSPNLAPACQEMRSKFPAA